MKELWFLLLGCLLPLNVGAVTITVNPSDALLNVGETFTVDLVADFGTDSVLGWGLDLAFDSSTVSLLGSPSIGASWMATSTPDGDGLAGFAFPVPITGSNVLLATLSFEALSVGTSDLIASYTTTDLTEGFPLLFPGSFASVQFINTTVTVVSAAVPEPSTFLLLTLALLGIGLSRRKLIDH